VAAAAVGVKPAVLLSGLALGLIGVGLWQGGEAAYIHAKAVLAQHLLERAWARTLAGEGQARPWPWADTWPLALLDVPRLNARMIVLAGGSGRTLAFGPGHVDGSPLPGAAGNSIIAGHRDTHFRVLKDLRPGDKIRLQARDGGRRSFRVTAAEVVDSRRTRLDPRGERPGLILVTCYPFDAVVPGGPLRLVILAQGAGPVGALSRPRPLADGLPREAPAPRPPSK
jgi:sortase A